MIFNQLIDIGDLNPNILLIVNVVVIVHLIAFVILILIVMRNMNKSEQTVFTERFVKMHKDAAIKENKKSK